MKLGTVSRNQLIGLILFLELVAAAAFVFYYIMPTNKKIGDVTTEINNMQRELRGIETTKKNLSDLQIEVQQYNDELKRLEQHFKQELFITRTLMLLEVLAGNTNVDIVAFKPNNQSKDARRSKPAAGAADKPTPAPAQKGGAKKPEPQKKVKSFNAAQEFTETKYELFLVGQFKNVYNFISELKDFPKLVVLDSLDMSADNSDSGDAGATAAGGSKGALQVKMPLTFYVQSAEPLVKFGGEDPGAATQEGAQPGQGAEPGMETVEE
jgi:Tfp pilus assembly protein PilO